MGERSSSQIMYSLRSRRSQVFYDQESENEPDGEEVHDDIPSEQDCDEDHDFDISKGQRVNKRAESNESEKEPGQAGRQRSIIKGKNNFRWSLNAPETRGRHSLPVYLPSAKEEARNITTPLEAWSLLFTQEMLEMIVQHTNEEIDRKREANANNPTFAKNTDIVELKALIGLLYFAGMEKNNHRNLEDLWDPEWGYNLYRAVMSERRFQYLLENLRFDDKNTRNARIKEHALAPIKVLWDIFIANCKKYYSPSSNCTIDEQLLGFRGRFRARVYIPNKPDKYGIKIVTCNDAQTSYLLNAEPYVGMVKTAAGDTVPSYYIKKLTEQIHHSQRNVTCDNWFMSVKIVQEMKHDYSLTMVGTLRKNKPEIPTTFKQSAAAGTVRYAYADGMTLLSYCPKKEKVVLLLSSLHKAGRMDEKIGKPEIVGFYNDTKGGTDTFDELCKNYTTNRITKRWPMRFFYGMLDQAGVNSAILYNLREANPTLIRRAFIKQLVQSMVKPYLEARLQNSTLRRNIRNLITDILGVNEREPLTTGKLEKRKRCFACNWKENKKTLYSCVLCETPVCENHRLHFCHNCAQ